MSLTSLFMYVETVLAQQGVEVDLDDDMTFAVIFVWAQLISLAAFTIWARGVGPRFRPDQMSDLT